MTPEEALSRARVLYNRMAAVFGTDDILKIRDELLAVYQLGLAAGRLVETPPPGTISNITTIEEAKKGERKWQIT